MNLLFVDTSAWALKALSRKRVFAAIAELLPDPDSGLAIKPEFEQSLLEIRSRRETNAVGISAAVAT